MALLLTGNTVTYAVCSQSCRDNAADFTGVGLAVINIVSLSDEASTMIIIESLLMNITTL